MSLSYLIGNPHNITLDVDSRIFLSTNDKMPEFGRDGKLFFKGDQAHKHVPAIMHFNGYAKAALWKHKNWFQKYFAVQDNVMVSFRINSGGKRKTWLQLCGTVHHD